MIDRLIQGGFTPAESYFLAQAAYIKEQKRDARVPPTVLSRSATSYEINQTLQRLGPYPLGVEAHRQRIILWEKIFGRGSWHEPIDPDDIYGAAPSVSDPAKTFQLILPGQPGMNAGGVYEYVLSAAAEQELKQRALSEGYTIDPSTMAVQIVDVDQMRSEGHDMEAVGFEDDTHVAAYVSGQGSKQSHSS